MSVSACSTASVADVDDREDEDFGPKPVSRLEVTIYSRIFVIFYIKS